MIEAPVTPRGHRRAQPLLRLASVVCPGLLKSLLVHPELVLQRLQHSPEGLPVGPGASRDHRGIELLNTVLHPGKFIGHHAILRLRVPVGHALE